jgi:hypothetical protein
MVVEPLLFETRGSWNGRGGQRAGQAILVRYRVAAGRQRGTFCKLRAVLGSAFGRLRDVD